MSVNRVSIGPNNGLLPIQRQAIYLNQCWVIDNWTPGNIFQWNLNLNSIIFIQENAIENVVCLNGSNFVRGRWVNQLKSVYISCIYFPDEGKSLEESDMTPYRTPHVVHDGIATPPTKSSTKPQPKLDLDVDNFTPRIKALKETEREEAFTRSVKEQKDRVSRIRKARKAAEVIQDAWRKYSQRQGVNQGQVKIKYVHYKSWVQMHHLYGLQFKWSWKYIVLWIFRHYQYHISKLFETFQTWTALIFWF